MLVARAKNLERKRYRLVKQLNFIVGQLVFEAILICNKNNLPPELARHIIMTTILPNKKL